MPKNTPNAAPNATLAFSLDQRVLVKGWNADNPPPARITGRRLEDALASDGTVTAEAFYRIEVCQLDGFGSAKVAESALVADPEPGPWPESREAIIARMHESERVL